ncbi:MAG: type II toxin-antitoxin system death-on-curing family toxin, partial [Candidatus Heimdallarchaeota archaeon]
MRLPSIEQILEAHKKSIQRFGGEKGILHKEQLVSFVESMNQAFIFGQKDTIGLASWIVVRLVQNHYFVDGNKRVALATMLNFLKSNGCDWQTATNDFFYSLTMFIARNENRDLIDKVDQQLREVV